MSPMMPITKTLATPCRLSSCVQRACTAAITGPGRGHPAEPSTWGSARLSRLSSPSLSPARLQTHSLAAFLCHLRAFQTRARLPARATEFICQDNYNQIGYVDRSINGMQILAAHENIKKTLDNQKIMWYKTHTEQINFSALMKKRFTSVLQHQCKLENDVAGLQREVNYLRKLLLTPDNLKPGFACWSSRTCAVNFNQTNNCAAPCSMTPPSGCTSSFLQTSLTLPGSPPSTSLSCTGANAAGSTF